MRPIATDVEWSVCTSVYLCLLDTTMNRAKTVEPIDLPFELWTRVGPRNHVLSGSSDPYMERSG